MAMRAAVGEKLQDFYLAARRRYRHVEQRIGLARNGNTTGCGCRWQGAAQGRLRQGSTRSSRTETGNQSSEKLTTLHDGSGLITGRHGINAVFLEFVTGAISVILTLEGADLDAVPDLFANHGFLHAGIETDQGQVGFLRFGV